jgi:subfamily B ATP-binding cassette protein MsbA
VFVTLIQPIVDVMFLNKPQSEVGKDILTKLFFKHVYEGREQLVWLIPLMLVIVMFCRGLFTFLSSYFMKYIGLKIVKDMRNDLFERLVYQSADFFDKESTGDLMSRITNDVDRVQEAVSGNMADFVRETCILAALLAFIFIKSWQLALTSFVVIPMAVIPLFILSKYLRKKGKQNQERVSVLYRHLFETITGQRIVKAFTMEKFELKKFCQATQNYFKTNLKLVMIGSFASPFMEFMGGILGAFILVVGAHKISEGSLSPGDFSAFLMAIFMMFMPIRRLSRANNAIQHGVASYERIKDILFSNPLVVDVPGAYPMPLIRGHVKFQNVSFAYNNNNPVLEHISFEVEPNEMIALVGLSGGGKTTLINLISRFYDPASGKITIDGIDIREVTLKSLRSQVGLVTQDLILFNDTVINNIAYGLEDVPLKNIIKAAKAAKAHEFIKELPYGYESQIGEGGGLLSSGQRQRLAIARALLKDPPILILDEATSALDSESEKLIQAALTNVMKDRTTFVIAHRLSTIRNASKIMVIDQGKIAEIGTHRELCLNNGIYKKLYDLQFPERKEESA